MQHYVGLDVSVKETSVCIVDKAGKVIREVKVATKPPVLLPDCSYGFPLILQVESNQLVLKTMAQGAFRNLGGDTGA